MTYIFAHNAQRTFTMIEITEHETNSRAFIPLPLFIESDGVCCLIDGSLLVDTELQDICEQLNGSDYYILRTIDRRTIVVNKEIVEGIKQKDELTYMNINLHDQEIPLDHSFDEIKAILGCGIQEKTIKTKGL
jgi:hypothetical protein